MKSCLPAATFILGLVVCGCASTHGGLVLDPVGPAATQPSQAGKRGRLVVYSAFDVIARASSTDSDRRHHTDYTITDPEGHFLRKVRNDNGSILEGPVQVDLAPGAYRVVARAEGYGRVTVPVVVAADRLTEVHLEGSGAKATVQVAEAARAVRLPDGQFVGWRAGAPGQSKP